jgi:periplasmic divalent cation tolerance protein
VLRRVTDHAVDISPQIHDEYDHNLRMISQHAPDLVLVLTTWPADRDPAAVARTLVDAGLAACVNALPPMHSTYRWQGRVAVDMEQQLIIKTRREHVVAVATRLAALHPYDVPELLILDVAGGSTRYLEWVRASTVVATPVRPAPAPRRRAGR